MNSIYSRLITLQEDIIQHTIENGLSQPSLSVLSVAQLNILLTKERADDIIRTIRRSAPSKKAGKLTSLPLFKVWFYHILLNRFDLVPETWDILMTFGAVDTSNSQLNVINQLDSFFQEGIAAFFEPSTFQGLYTGYGLSLMSQINQDFTILNNLDEIFMIKQFIKSVGDGATDRLIEEAQIVGYYTPSLSDSVVRMILAAQDTATLQRLMLIKGWNNSNKACLNINFLGSILKDLKIRAITDTSEAYPGIMMTNSSKPNDYRNNYNKNKNFKKNFNKNQKPTLIHNITNTINSNSSHNSTINVNDHINQPKDLQSDINANPMLLPELINEAAELSSSTTSDSVDKDKCDHPIHDNNFIPVIDEPPVPHSQNATTNNQQNNSLIKTSDSKKSTKRIKNRSNEIPKVDSNLVQSRERHHKSHPHKSTKSTSRFTKNKNKKSTSSELQLPIKCQPISAKM